MQEVFEKIVEKLEEMIHPKQLYFCKYARGGCKHLDNDDKDCMECVVENAIEIVKQCGVSDDVCEYEYHTALSKDIYFLTSCGHRHNGRLDNDLPYCGFCGKKIKEVK